MSKSLKGYVIDTHIFLWLINSPEKINSDIMNILHHSKTPIYIANISFFEVSIKYNLGKLILEGLLPYDLPTVAKEFGFEILDIASDVMATFYQLPKVDNHKDPFDRLIIWQCIQKNYVLISQDTKFLNYKKIGLSLMQ